MVSICTPNDSGAHVPAAEVTVAIRALILRYIPLHAQALRKAPARTTNTAA